MESDTTSELGEEEPTTDENYRDGWDSQETGNDPMMALDYQRIPERKEFNGYEMGWDNMLRPPDRSRPTKTLSDDR